MAVLLSDLPQQFFVSGTDTNVGKTVVSALLTLGMGATYWKPIQSGLTPVTDRQFVQRVTELDDSHFIPERHCLTQPLSPHAAAALDGIEIAVRQFELPARSKLIVEGAGGLLVPLNSHELMIDLIQHLQLPVCLVARSTLGTINHTLLSLAQLRQREIPVLGVVLNGPKNAINRAAIAHHGQVPILAELDVLNEINRITLQHTFQTLTTV
jgi:dethiobiotin synthetase